MTGKKRPRCILIIEENPSHVELLTELFDRHCAPIVIHAVESFGEAANFLEKHDYDLICSTEIAQEEKLLHHLGRLLELSLGAPIMVITGSGNERLAAELIKRGASEYLLKTREALEQLPELANRHLSKRHKIRPRKLRAVKRDEASSSQETLQMELDRIIKLTHDQNPSRKKLQKLTLQLERFQSLLRKTMS